MRNKTKILHFIPGFDHGGIESRLLDWYCEIDKNEFQMDLIKLTSTSNQFIDEFKLLGGNVYTLPKFSIKTFVSFRRELRNFFRHNNDYDVVHCHSPTTGKFFLEEAKKNNIPIRIMHSRAVKIDPNSSMLFYRKILKKQAVSLANEYFACSKEAGEWMFGNSKSSSQEFKVINNGIKAEKFNFNEVTRETIRKELNIENKFVIGNVSRFTESKNHNLLVDLLYELTVRKLDTHLLLLGDGPKIEFIKELAVNKGVRDRICFLGAKANVEDYYQAMDIFVFPSEYEGFGTVAVEAQAAGLKTIVSTGVPNSVDLTDLIKHLPIDINISIWADEVIKNSNYVRKKRYSEIKNLGFDVETTVKELERVYSKN